MSCPYIAISPERYQPSYDFPGFAVPQPPIVLELRTATTQAWHGMKDAPERCQRYQLLRTADGKEKALQGTI